MFVALHGKNIEVKHQNDTKRLSCHHCKVFKHKWNMFLFVTGMEEALCEKAAYVSTYLDNTDDFNVIQGPAARIRPSRLPENYFSCEFLSVGPAASLGVCFICNRCGWRCPVSLSSVDYEGVVKKLSVCEAFQMWLLYSQEEWKIICLLGFTSNNPILPLLCVDSPFLCLFWSAGPLISQWGRTSKKTSPKGCTSPSTSALREHTYIWRRDGRLRCKSQIDLCFRCVKNVSRSWKEGNHPRTLKTTHHVDMHVKQADWLILLRWKLKS